MSIWNTNRSSKIFIQYKLYLFRWHAWYPPHTGCTATYKIAQPQRNISSPRLAHSPQKMSVVVLQTSTTPCWSYYFQVDQAQATHAPLLLLSSAPLRRASRLFSNKFQDASQTYELGDVWEDGGDVSSCSPCYSADRLSKYRTDMYSAYRFLACSIGGPALVYYVSPTEEELFKRYNPDLQKRSLENRNRKQQEFDDFVGHLKEYSKSNKPSTLWMGLHERLWLTCNEQSGKQQQKQSGKGNKRSLTSDRRAEAANNGWEYGM